jgi:hypothetical protein
MLKAALFTLLVVSVLNGPLQAQRAGATFHGNAAGQHGRSGLAGRRGFSNRGFSNRSRRRDGFGSHLLPYDDWLGYEQPEPETTADAPAPPPVVIPRAAESPVPKAQVIEIPGDKNAIVRVLPPTIFILATGERLEARRYVLTASNLSLSIGRQERTVPLDVLDIDATIAANHVRGIDLRIPESRNEISLSF